MSRPPAEQDVSGVSWAQAELKALKRASLLLLRKLLLVSVAVLLVVILVLVTYDPQRSFLIEAETRSAELRFVPGANTWRFPRAVICTPLDSPRRTPDPECGLAAEAAGPQGEVILAWDPGVHIRIASSASEGLEVRALSVGQPGLPEGATVRVAPSDVAGVGALVFAASIALGADMTSGLQSYLLEGRWEARESGFVISPFQAPTAVVKSGALSRGTRVAILNGADPARAFGHITFEADGIGYTTILSEAGDTSLQLRYFGLDRPVRLAPNWIDLTLSSPLILALSVLLALFATVSQIISVSAKRDGDDRDDAEDGGRAAVKTAAKEDSKEETMAEGGG